MIRSANRDPLEHYTWGDRCDGWRLLDAPSLSVIEEQMPAGTSEQRHHHVRAQQLFYLLDGQLEITLDGTAHRLAPRESLRIAPGVVHVVHNPGPAIARFLVVSEPNTRGDRALDPTSG